jgi:L,D-transpeptidase ErfK/SrfK
VLAGEEDTLADIARRFDLGYGEIIAANPGVDPWLPGKGTRILLPTQFILPDSPREGLVLNLSAMRLFYYPEPGPGEMPVVITHPIGIGRQGWATPKGLTRIVSKAVKPSWIVPASIRAEHRALGDPLPAVVPAGPDNPLGDFALRLGMPSYLLHGTNKPYGIGMRVSHGCVRLYPEDIARLFPTVDVGTKVLMVNQPYLLGWSAGTLYLEAHPPLEEEAERRRSSFERIMNMAKRKADETQTALDSQAAEVVAKQARGIPLPITVGAPGLQALMTSASVVKNLPPRSLPAVSTLSSLP